MLEPRGTVSTQDVFGELRVSEICVVMGVLVGRGELESGVSGREKWRGKTRRQKTMNYTKRRGSFC